VDHRAASVDRLHLGTRPRRELPRVELAPLHLERLERAGRPDDPGDTDLVDAAGGKDERRPGEPVRSEPHSDPCRRSVQLSIARLVGTPRMSRPRWFLTTSYWKSNRGCPGSTKRAGIVRATSGEYVRIVCESGKRLPPWRLIVSPL